MAYMGSPIPQQAIASLLRSGLHGSPIPQQVMTSLLRRAVVPACSAGFLSGLFRGSFTLPRSLMRIGRKLFKWQGFLFVLKALRGIYRVDGSWRKVSGGGKGNGGEHCRVWEGPGPCCSLEAPMSCFRAHLRHPQAVFLGRAFTSAAIYHRASGLSRTTSPPCSPLLSRHLHRGLLFLGDPLTTLFSSQLCWLQPSYFLQIILTRLLQPLVSSSLVAVWCTHGCHPACLPCYTSSGLWR